MSRGATTVHEAVRNVASGILKRVSSPPTDLDALKPALNVTRILARIYRFRENLGGMAEPLISSTRARFPRNNGSSP